MIEKAETSLGVPSPTELSAQLHEEEAMAAAAAEGNDSPRVFCCVGEQGLF